MLTFDDLDKWLDELAQLDGVTSAVLDPAALRTPGVWCQVPSFAADTFAVDEFAVDLVLYLAVGDQDWRKARNKLAALFDPVYVHLGRPRVAVTFVKLALPDGTEVPALRFPHTLRIVPDPTD